MNAINCDYYAVGPDSVPSVWGGLYVPAVWYRPSGSGWDDIKTGLSAGGQCRLAFTDHLNKMYVITHCFADFIDTFED